MTATKISLANDDDVDVLGDLRYEWRTTERGELGLDLLAFREEWRQWWYAHRGSHAAFLARSGVDVVGCAWLVTVDRVPSPANLRRRGGMVQSVYVREARRDVGVGAMMMRALIDHARALELEFLIVHPSTRAFDFYRRLGFSDTEGLLELRIGH